MKLDYVVSKKDKLVGILDKNSDVVIPFIYESIFLVEGDIHRMVAQKNNEWLLIDKDNNILFRSQRNYDNTPQWDMNFFDSSYKYVPYCDGYFEQYKDKIVLITKDERKEFIVQSENAYCFSDEPIIDIENAGQSGYINIKTGEIQVCKVSKPKEELLFRTHEGFIELGAYEVDDILCAGEKPYSLFDQDLIVEELHTNGIKTIINLMQKEEFENYTTPLLEDNFKIINFPILDNSVPSKDIILHILHIINKSEKTYVHCNLGLGRTGIIIASYLHQKYAYRSKTILQKIKELKYSSKLFDKASPITQEQIAFVENLI